MEEDEEECKPCKVAVAIGMTLDVCRRLDGKEECDKLFDKVVKDEISPDEVFNMVRERAKKLGKEDELEILDYIVELVKEGEDEEQTE